MQVCTPIKLGCDYCFTLQLQFSSIMYVGVSLTPASTPYLWITDKFGNQYCEQITITVDGYITIDSSHYPAGMFQGNSWFDVFVTSDALGTTVIPMTFVNPYNCLKLQVLCYVPFVPSQLRFLIGWFKSDIGITKTSGVSKWADQSGGSHDLLQSNVSWQPTVLLNQLNGYPAISFDGIAQFLKTTTYTLVTPVTYFLVFKLRTYVVDKSIFDGSVTFGGTLRTNTGSPTVGIYNGAAYLEDNNLVAGTYERLTAIFNNGATSKLQVDSNAQEVGDIGFTTIQGFTLASRADMADFSQIDVVEIIIMSVEASATDRANVATYFNLKYGI